MPKSRPGASKKGDRVQFHYDVKFTTGFIVRSTREGPPAEVVLGSGGAAEALDKALRGLLPGEKRTVTVKPEKAFGKRQDNLMLPIPRDSLPGKTYELGQRVEINLPEDKVAYGIVRFIDEQMVVFDMNRPLAGHEVVYEVELINILSSDNK